MLSSNGNVGTVQLKAVFEMKPFEFMQEKECLGTIVNPLLTEAWFSARYMPIKHLRSSSDSLFGFVLVISSSK